MSGNARKICLLGEFGVGKTSLVARYVRSTFSERYLTTVGVKIDSKLVDCRHGSRKLVIWDIEGSNELSARTRTYLQGASGLLLVADGTRAATLDAALRLREQAIGGVGSGLPAVLVVNKVDLLAQWEIDIDRLAEIRESLPVMLASAFSGEQVEGAFRELAEQV